MAELMKYTGVTEVELNQQCSEEIFKQIAENVANWRSYAEELSLTPQETEQIRTDANLDVRLKVISVFKQWRKSQAFKATYRRLVEACLNLRDSITAQEICSRVHHLDLGLTDTK